MNRNFFFYILLFLASPVAAHRLELVPITLRVGKNYSSFHAFSKDAGIAKRAEVDLFTELDKFSKQGYNNHNAFVLFYNFVQATGCGRDYVIQTVKLTKKYYNRNGSIHHEKNKYLVEAMRLNEKKRTKKPDQHLKRYALGNAHKRDLVATYEVGCGNFRGSLTAIRGPLSRPRAIVGSRIIPNPLAYMIGSSSTFPYHIPLKLASMRMENSPSSCLIS